MEIIDAREFVAVQAGEVRTTRLLHGQMFVAAEGDEHIAHPVGEARILVIEKKGSE